jgi:hypothetical protein
MSHFAHDLVNACIFAGQTLQRGVEVHTFAKILWAAPRAQRSVGKLG